MNISESELDMIICQLKIEYNGTHNSDPKAPLWGRCAYWRIYNAKTGNYYSKITTPAKSINPNKNTLERLFRAELKRRINSINYGIGYTHCGEMYIETRDPCSMLRMLEDLLVRKYWDVDFNWTEDHKCIGLKERA